MPIYGHAPQNEVLEECLMMIPRDKEKLTQAHEELSKMLVC